MDSALLETYHVRVAQQASLAVYIVLFRHYVFYQASDVIQVSSNASGFTHYFVLIAIKSSS